MKHTPGQWQTKELFGSPQGRWAIFHKPPDESRTYRLDDCKGAFAEADARLIAAAPELLGALKQALAWMELPGNGQHALANDLRAAIAKAKGSEP